ncbi:MAG: D-alanyl-D-alanine carboxypeptidase family protein [Oscillospiraceae bacterium]|nr:D-alanyl-D-alanine carboxypeptidase family protein [Oscillospiraceae bacterium]
MKSVISGITYLLVGLTVILILLIIFVTFKAQVFDRIPIDEPQAITRDRLPNADISDTSEIWEAKPPTDEKNSPTYPVPSGNTSVNANESISYVGPLELPVNGATGYASVEMNVYNDDLTAVLAVLKPGNGFMILREYESWWQIYLKPDANGSEIIGWVPHNLCLVNLPDVIPSIIYNNTNAYASVFRANGETVPNVTGKRLYSYSDRSDGKTYNERLEKYEYIVPVLYAMAPKICAAQQNALENDDTLVIYEGFRPYATQQLVYSEVVKLPASQKNFGSWSQSWFIAYGKSNHQIGYAMDASLARVLEKEDKVTGRYKYRQLKYFEYTMPTAIHELSVNSALYASSNSRTYSEGVKNSEPARHLQSYCISAGLTPLASEWWHFNDEAAHAGITRESSGDFVVTECFSSSPSQ